MFKYSHLSFFLLTGSAFAMIPLDNLWAYDPSFEKAARATYGQYYNVKPNDLPNLPDALAAQLQGREGSSLLLDAKINLTEPQNPFSIEISEQVQHLTVTLSGLDQSVQTHLQLVRPSGAIVEPNDNAVSVTHLSSADTITIILPESGTWQIFVSGRGEALLSAVGRSEEDETNIYRASFVRANEDIHGGFFPLPSVPPPNSRLFTVLLCLSQCWTPSSLLFARRTRLL